MRFDLLYRLLLPVLSVLLGMVSRRRVRGVEHLPTYGGALVVCNHISAADPLYLVDAVARSGRRPRAMATGGLFQHALLGPVMRAMGHIPVLRGTVRAMDALAPAARALDAGEVLMLYPEGGISSGDQWPAPGKTGAARLALAAGVPVVPVAQWGAQRVLPPHTPRAWQYTLRTLCRRPPVEVLVGAPLRLTGDPENRSDVAAATAAIMAAITSQLEELRGGKPQEVSDAGRAA